jgi:hypothetical protein
MGTQETALIRRLKEEQTSGKVTAPLFIYGSYKTIFSPIVK